MSLTKSLALKKQLTEEQKAFLLSKELEGNFRPLKLLDFLAMVARYDQYTDKARKQLGIAIAICFVAGFLLGIFVSFWILLIGILLGVALIFFRRSLKKNDLENNLRNFTVPLVGILEEEIAPNSKIHVAINSKAPMLKENLYDVHKRTTSLGRTTSFYRSHWLTIKAEVIDGSKLTLQNEDLVRKIEIKKRGSSGKIKYKTKYKKAVIVTINVEFPKDRFRLVRMEEDMPFDVDISGSSILVKRKVKLKFPALEEVFPMNRYLKCIKDIYTVVQPLGAAQA